MSAYEIADELNNLGDALRGEQRALCYAAADKIEQLLREINNLRLKCGVDPA